MSDKPQSSHSTSSGQAGQALQESEAKYRAIIETTDTGFVILDYQGRVLDANSKYVRLTGHNELSEILGRCVTEWTAEHEKEKNAQAVAQCIREGQIRGLIIDYIDGNGRITPIEINATTQGEGARQYITTLCRDITERKRTEAALRESEGRYRRLVENLKGTYFIYRHDTQGVFTYLSETLEMIMGYTPAEFKTHYSHFLTDHPVNQKVKQCTNLSLQGIQQPPYEVNIRHKDGSIRWLEVQEVPVFNAEQQVIAIEGVAQDITARKRAEEERVKLQAQLTQAQKMESVGRLAGGVAHDFNNMLGVILGHTEMALERVPPAEPLHADLEEIKKAAQHSADLTRQLLTFARKQIVVPQVIDLNDVIETMLKMLRRLIGEDIDLVWRPGKDVWPVKMDPVQIDQILANLCVNARDAITGVGKVTIATDNTVFGEDFCARHVGSVPGDYVRLTVSDSGCGMDGATLSHLFEPFFTTKELGKGTGLGLATLYGAVKQNHGFITVDSHLGQGTTFKIYLPRHARKSALEIEERRPPAEARDVKTILLVEDEPAVLSITTTMLRRLGYTVLSASTPGQAIHLAQEHSGRIDLLMTDVVMPEMNGRDLAKNLLSSYPAIQRLFMSGYTADVIAHHGVLDKGVHFIQKPFFMKDLGAKLREILEGG